MTRVAFGWLLLGAGLFMLAGWIGSSIPRNPGWNEAESGIDILVESNGVHTSLILPAQTRWRDWYRDFPPGHTGAPNRAYTHVSIGWGEREVFLNTPTWANLSPWTVLRILGADGEGMMHVAHYVRPASGERTRPLRLSPAQYQRLVAKIETLLPPPGARKYPGYGDSDAFYETGGRYSYTNTCNQWTSDVLAAAGVQTGWWTPFAGGVMKWFPEPGERR
ncbi:MAG: TIGR02117 family protein [Sphingomonadaceae bacterium]